jgi:hypothetical protein
MTSEKPKLRKENHLELARIKRNLTTARLEKSNSNSVSRWKSNIEGGGDDAASNPSINITHLPSEISAVNRISQNKNSSHQLTRLRG